MAAIAIYEQNAQARKKFRKKGWLKRSAQLITTSLPVSSTTIKCVNSQTFMHDALYRHLRSNKLRVARFAAKVVSYFAILFVYSAVYKSNQ